MSEGCEIHKCLFIALKKSNCQALSKQMSAKLCAAGYVVRKMGQVHVSKINTLKSIYYAYFNALIEYGIICGCNSSRSGKNFHFTQERNFVYGCCTNQKLMGSLLRDSACSVPAYTLSLNKLIVSNQENFSKLSNTLY